MFFMSEFLIDTFLKAVYDMSYRKHNQNVIVLINYIDFERLSQQTTTVPYAAYAIKPDNITVWALGGFEIHFKRSMDVEAGKMFLFYDSEVITITYQKQEG